MRPRSTNSSSAPGDPAWSWDLIVVALADIIIRTHADLDTPKTGYLHPQRLCRIIGRPRYVMGVSRAKIEVLTPNFWNHEESRVSSFFGGYVSLSAAKVDGPLHFRRATSADEPLLYEDAPLSSVQLEKEPVATEGLDWTWLSKEDVEDIAILRALVAKALPDPALQVRVDELHEPPQKARTEGPYGLSTH
eukprot:6436275-Amphidinium_carterae.2